MNIERDIIRKFRVTSKYKGFFLLIDAIEIYLEKYNHSSYISMNDHIYKILAEKYETTSYCVEHNIRTLIERCWKNDRTFMENIFGCPLKCCPSNREFIDSVAYYISHPPKILCESPQ